ERQRPRLVGDERVGARIDDEAVLPDRGHRPAEACARLEQLDRRATLHRAQRRRDAGDPAADDRDTRHPLAVLPTTSVSAAMNAGWSFTVEARTNPMRSAAAVARASTSRS